MTTTQTKDLAGRYCRVVIPVSTCPSKSVARDDTVLPVAPRHKGKLHHYPAVRTGDLRTLLRSSALATGPTVLG